MRTKGTGSRTEQDREADRSCVLSFLSIAHVIEPTNSVKESQGGTEGAQYVGGSQSQYLELPHCANIVTATSSDVPDPMRRQVPHEAEAVESCCLMYPFRSWETAAATQCAQTAHTDLTEKILSQDRQVWDLGKSLML